MTVLVEAQDRVLTILKTALPSYDVSDGPAKAPSKRYIEIMDANWDTYKFQVIGTMRREERFSIKVCMAVVLKGGTANESRKIALEDFAQIELATKQDPTLSNTVMTSELRLTTVKAGPIDSGETLVYIEFFIDCYNRS